MVDQEHRKQHEQVEDGEHEQSLSSAAIGPSASVELTCEQKEKRPADRDRRAIDGPCKSEHPGQLRGQNQEAAVDQYLPRCSSPSRDNRQHGDAGSGIIISTIYRARPEQELLPKEDNEEQRNRLQP